MMYVKSSSPHSSKSGSIRVTQMGVPMTEIKPKKVETSRVNHTRSMGRSNSTESSSASKTKISSGKVILFSLVFGLAGLIYLNHVFSTQQRLKEVIQLQREYEKVKRLYADRKFTYDRMIGPAEVYNRAKKLGLKDGGPADGVIYVESKD